MHLTIAFVTGRDEPMVQWFHDSLESQIQPGDDISTVCVSAKFKPDELRMPSSPYFTVSPKPTVWQGSHRLTKEDWWAMSNARNTAICLAQDGYIVFLDDRCILGPKWMGAVRDAMNGNYAIAGTYTKYHGLNSDGTFDHLQATDSRLPFAKPGCNPCGGEWFFGCSCGLPLEWALNVNGWDEDCDSMGYEDVYFGLMLEKNGYPIRFDQRMAVLQDRTPSESGPIYKRQDPGQSPHDKSHAMLNMVKNGRLKSPNYHGVGGLREVRRRVLAGEPFPIVQIPQHEWFTGKPISEL